MAQTSAAIAVGPPPTWIALIAVSLPPGCGTNGVALVLAFVPTVSRGPVTGSRPCGRSTVFTHTGCGAVWLARLTGGQEVAGSNPVSPTAKGQVNRSFGEGLGPDGESLATPGTTWAALGLDMRTWSAPTVPGASTSESCVFVDATGTCRCPMRWWRIGRNESDLEQIRDHLARAVAQDDARSNFGPSSFAWTASSDGSRAIPWLVRPR